MPSVICFIDSLIKSFNSILFLQINICVFSSMPNAPHHRPQAESTGMLACGNNVSIVECFTKTALCLGSVCMRLLHGRLMAATDNPGSRLCIFYGFSRSDACHLRAGASTRNTVWQHERERILDWFILHGMTTAESLEILPTCK